MAPNVLIQSLPTIGPTDERNEQQAGIVAPRMTLESS